MIRTECAVCCSVELKQEFSLKNYPIKFLGDADSKNDQVIDHTLVSCKSCFCLQLQNLVDPTILYSMSHNSSKSEVWLKHHKLLADFIYEGLQEYPLKKIVEIGGSSGVIAEHLSGYADVDYTIFDLCDHDPKIPNVKFLVGNCESADFTDDSSIVMSHVFEHLYEPNKFVKNMARNNIRSIFLSVPNMTLQLANKIHPVIYQEHTFFCELDDIKMIFAQYGYKTKKEYFYGIHAILIHFEKTSESVELVRSRDYSTVKTILDVYTEKKRITEALVLDSPYFVIPACFSGQLINYNILPQYKKNILGFLDNDKTKTGKRMYGTDVFVYRMEEVLKYDGPLKIVIHKGAYVDEIVKQLTGYKSDIEFHYV